MRLKEAAFIVGSLGGRPTTRIYFDDRRRGGFFIPPDTSYLLLEDGFKVILEDSSGFVLLQ